jgi:hypothetical protein
MCLISEMEFQEKENKIQTMYRQILIYIRVEIIKKLVMIVW